MKEKTYKEKLTMKETKTDVVSYGYYSKLLNKPFDTLDELKAAEEEYHKAHDEELKRAEERKQRAKAVEEAYRHSMDVRREANEAIRKADEEYYKLRNEFVKDYGSYHVSYSNKDGNEVVTVSDLFDSFFNKLWF